MDIGVFVSIGVAALLIGYFGFRGLRSYFKLRGKRLITCPETQRPAAVELDARRAAREALLGTPHFVLSECSRWPERQGCGQECLSQIEAAPEDCLIRNIVHKWHAGKACIYCGMSVDISEELVGHTPALRDPQGTTLYWDQIARRERGAHCRPTRRG